MDLATYRELRIRARRLSRRAADVEDLVQDTLLAALQAGRDDPAWLAGVMQQQAAMAARTALRRRKREDQAVSQTASTQEYAVGDISVAVLDRFPPAARRVAVLALHGLGSEEIRWILGITPTAFRQRLTSIRKRLGELPPEQQAEALALAYVRDPARAVELQFGLVRRALKAALRGLEGLATHDADGHLLVIRGRSHLVPPRQQGQ
jgi:DNA-directed RNA polymerase specialized sigma24 family protein